MIILIHSSKTMKIGNSSPDMSKPILLNKSKILAEYLKSLSVSEIQSIMKISESLAIQTKELIDKWNTDTKKHSCAMDTFKGDIYSGLQVESFNKDDRLYANQQLKILSGLYGILRPLDAICPYRLEMGYKLTKQPFTNLYEFWGSDLANTLPKDKIIVDLTSLEYGKAIIPNLNSNNVYIPKFFTQNPITKKPVQVVVHSKIARGAFAHYLIKNKAENELSIRNFNELGYVYQPELSTNNNPVFLCKNFGGLGLSVRLK